MKFIVTLFLLIFFEFTLRAQNAFDKILVVDSKVETKVNVINQGEAYLEIPPWVKSGGWRSYYFTTHFTKIFSTPISLTDNELTTLNLSGYTPTIVSSSLTWWNGFQIPNTISNTSLQWRRNYLGTFSSHAITTTTKGNIVVAYQHGENKNEIIGPYQYKGTVWKSDEHKIDLNDTNSYSGVKPGGLYSDGWPAYFAFLNMSWVENTAASNWGEKYFWEQGPIVWPSNGYITSERQQASFGLRHPTSIQAGNYIYIYYVDTRTLPGYVPGRDEGIKVARVLTNDAWDYTKYQVYYNGGWQSSLPLGYTQATFMNFFDKQGPMSTSVLGQNQGSKRFAVAKVANENFYLGVEEYTDYYDHDRIKMAIRASADLVNWSPRKEILADAASWEEGIYHYPIFLDQTGWTNTQIDLTQFYILGTQAKQPSVINRMRLRIHFDNGIIISPDREQINDLQQEELIKQNDIYISTLREGNILYIVTNENSPHKKVSVYSTLGQLVHQEVLDDSSSGSFQLQTTHLSEGIYILVIETKTNRYTKKLQIQ
jgi:hypothetical protein